MTTGKTFEEISIFVFARFLARLLIRFLGRVLTRVLGEARKNKYSVQYFPASRKNN